MQFVGISMLMGLLKFPNKNCFWCTEPLYKNIIPNIMSRDKYKFLSAMFHLSDYENEEKMNNKKNVDIS